MAIAFFTTSAGGAALPPLVQLVISAWHWRAAWALLGAIVFVLGLLPTVVLVRRRPEDLGLAVDGEAAPDDRHALTAEAVESASGHSETAWPLGRALRDATLWLLLPAVFAGGVVSTGVALHLMPHLLQRGLTPAGAVGAVSLGFIASALGTFGWGYAADRLSAYAPLLATYLLRAGSLLLLLLADSLPEAYGFAVLQGLAEGGMSVLLPLLLAEYYGRQHLGALYGVLRAVQVAGFAVGPLIAGAAFDLTHRYDAAFVLFVLCGVLGAALMAGARRTEVPRPA